jgi:hypothetical protein
MGPSDCSIFILLHFYGITDILKIHLHNLQTQRIAFHDKKNADFDPDKKELPDQPLLIRLNLFSFILYMISMITSFSVMNQ